MAPRRAAGVPRAAKRSKLTDGASDVLPEEGQMLQPSPEKSPNPKSLKKKKGDGADRPVENPGKEEDGRKKAAGSEQQVILSKAEEAAKRAIGLCEERAAAANALGETWPELSELLVEPTWFDALQGELKQTYMKDLSRFVREEASAKEPIYPPPPMVFRALNSVPFDQVKVVILGQDPYHGPRQAMGLCFSVPEGEKIPSSLLNVFKELKTDLGCSIPSHGNLERWTYQGVLLLNTVLTVRQAKPNSHAKRGWERFTDAAIRALSESRSGLVFLLWGKPAQDKSRLIDARKHHILNAAHPSGLSAHRGFFGCKHFSAANKLLEEAGELPIDWQV